MGVNHIEFLFKNQFFKRLVRIYHTFRVLAVKRYLDMFYSCLGKLFYIRAAVRCNGNLDSALCQSL